MAAAIIQGTSNLVGIAGFDSESGPGIGQAIKEARKLGQIVGTCVEAEEAHLRLLEEGALSACIGQKRELFTYYGLRILFDAVHSRLRLTKDDARAGTSPIPSSINTGSYIVTRDNLSAFLKTMNSRERALAALNHSEPDLVPIDLGSTIGVVVVVGGGVVAAW